MKQKHLKNKNKIKKIETTIMKKRFWKDNDEQKILERLNIKIETEKLKKLNKIEGHKVRMESIKDTTNRLAEQLMIERIN